MNHDDWTVDLPSATSAWEENRTDEIERALEADLSSQLAGLLDGACQSGGWPEDEEIEVSMKALTPERLTADITIYFTEMISSSCKDMPHRQPREHRLIIDVKAGDSFGSLDYSTSDSNQWNLLDRNSAADGA